MTMSKLKLNYPDCNVLLMQGLPGSGKSSYARNTKQNYPEAVIVSADDEHINSEGKYEFKASNIKHAHDACLLKYIKALQDSSPLVIVDNTNTSYDELLPYVRIAQAYQYFVTLTYLPCSVEDSHKRNTHGVPLESIKKMDERLKKFHLNLPSNWIVITP